MAVDVFVPLTQLFFLRPTHKRDLFWSGEPFYFGRFRFYNRPRAPFKRSRVWRGNRCDYRIETCHGKCGTFGCNYVPDGSLVLVNSGCLSSRAVDSSTPRFHLTTAECLLPKYAPPFRLRYRARPSLVSESGESP